MSRGRPGRPAHRRLLCPIKPLDKSANADGQRRRARPRRARPLAPLPPVRHRAAAAPAARRVRRHRPAAGVLLPTRTTRTARHEPATARPLRAEVESLLARVAHRGDLCAARARELLLAHRARPDPRGRLRHDPRRSRHRQERRLAPAGRAFVRASADVTVGASTIRRATWPTSIASWATSSPCACARTTAGAASRPCANAGSRIWRRPAAPVLLVDEAQEMSPAALCELRLLASARFDSQPLLCVVLAGDARLIEKLRREDLIPLGSRIRTRLATEHATREEIAGLPDHLLTSAGNASLMTPAAASHAVRSRRRQLPHPHHARRRTARRCAAKREAAAARREALPRGLRAARHTNHPPRGDPTLSRHATS